MDGTGKGMEDVLAVAPTKMATGTLVRALVSLTVVLVLAVLTIGHHAWTAWAAHRGLTLSGRAAGVSVFIGRINDQGKDSLRVVAISRVGVLCNSLQPFPDAPGDSVCSGGIRGQSIVVTAVPHGRGGERLRTPPDWPFELMARVVPSRPPAPLGQREDRVV